jgi:excisionase family DNA binding protein
LGKSQRGTQTAEPWTSVDDVARHLGVAKDSIYRWIDRRNLPAHRIGRLWKFKLSEVDDWVRAGGANSASKDEA